MEDVSATEGSEALVNIGRAIRGLRGEARMSQGALADAAGISRSTMKRIEMGEHDYMTSTLLAIAEGLGVGADVVLRRAGIIR